MRSSSSVPHLEKRIFQSRRFVESEPSTSACRPRRSGGSLAFSSEGNSSSKSADIRIDAFHHTMFRRTDCHCCELLGLEPPGGHPFGFVRGKVDEHLRDFGGISPLIWVFIWLCRTTHCCVHAAWIDPVDSHFTLLQLRRPGLRHAFEAELRDAVCTPASVSNNPGVAGDVNDRAPKERPVPLGRPRRNQQMEVFRRATPVARERTLPRHACQHHYLPFRSTPPPGGCFGALSL